MSANLTDFQKKQKEGNAIQAIKNDSKLNLEVKLDCFEFTWNCPAIQQPDYGKVLITYTPHLRIAETKSVKMYLQQFRYKNAFNEELTNRICLDFIYYIQPMKVKIELAQNPRGGIANTCIVEWNSKDADDNMLWEDLNYTPKKNFQGGWSMIKEGK